MLDVYINQIQVHYLSAEVQRSVESFCGSFAVELKSSVNCKLYDEIDIFSRDAKVMTGIIENISQSRDNSNFTLSISGRDKTGELIDSYMKPKQYKQKNFVALVKGVLQDNGYDFKILQNVSDLRLIDKVVDSGREKIFDFLDDYAKKAQVLLLTNEEGDIVITREGTDLPKQTLDESIIINSTLSSNSSEKYKYIDVYGSLKTDYSKKRIKSSASILNNSASGNKRVIIRAENNSSKQTLHSLANWYKNIKQAKGARYECSVNKHFQGNVLWQANSIVNLIDETRNISGNFLIQGVKYRSGVDGNFTDLSIVNLGSFGLPPLNPLLSKLISSGDDLGKKFN
jgi:prophage tail gpP-like protein